MASEKKTQFTLKNPFSLKRKKPAMGNIHSFNTGCADSPTSMKNSGLDSADESNVAKLWKIMPGFCRLKKCTSENGVKPPMDYCVTQKFSPKDFGRVIDVNPPDKSIRNMQTTPFQNSHGDASRSQNHSAHRKHRKESRRLKGRHRDRPRLEFNRLCLNVKVFGPMYCTLGQMLNNNIKNIVTIAGAGVSTSAGIPDFRSPDTGLYNNLKKYNLPYAQAVFERKYFDKNPKPLFALLKQTLANEYKPTMAHYFVKLLEEKGLLLRHFTQNVDGLERLAGISDDRLVEAHGTVYVSRCMKCKTEYGLLWLRDQLVIQGKSIPYCRDSRCLGIVKPNIVLFGESLDSRFTRRVSSDLPRSDLVIIMGTSLVVEPFASTVKKVSSTCPRIIINNIPVGEHLGILYEGSKGVQKKKMKGVWRDIFIQGSCDEGVLHLAKLFKWEDALEALVKRCEPSSTSASEVPKRSRTTHSSRTYEEYGKSPQSHHSASVSKSSKAIRSSEAHRKSPQKDTCTSENAAIDEAVIAAEPTEPEPGNPPSRNVWQQFKSHVRSVFGSRCNDDG